MNLKKSLTEQQTFFTKGNKEIENAVRVSYAISEIIAARMKPFSDGEFVKECIDVVADIMCPEKKQIISSISLSRFTVAKRVDEMAENIEVTLKETVEKFKASYVCLNEFTDVSDTTQLAIFVRGVNSDFNITQEMLKLASKKGTMTGDLFNELKDALQKYNLIFTKLSGVTTNGAPAITGKNNGLTALLLAELKKFEFESEPIVSHCIIHQENLCAKRFLMNHIMSIIISTVNFIQSRALNHKRFKKLLSDIDAEYGDVIYYSEVQWLSRRKVLQRFCSLQEEIKLFMEMKEKPVLELSDEEWFLDLVFLVDIITHLNNLNMKLQGKDQLINNLFDHMKGFQIKFRLWGSQLSKNNGVHFQNLHARATTNNDLTKFAHKLNALKSKFVERFSDFVVHEKDFSIFSSPFCVNVETIPESLQMEIIELQCNSELKNKFSEVPLIVFYKLYLSKKTFQNFTFMFLK